MSAYEARWLDSRDGRFGRDLIRVSDGVEIANDYGEPEDKSFGRDLAPVVDELNALAARLAAAEASLREARGEAERLRRALRSMLDSHADCDDGSGTICPACAIAMAELSALTSPSSPVEGDDGWREAYEAQVRRVVTALASGTATCCRDPAHGDRMLPATCVGAYENPADLQLGCEACCSHGNEDGWCVPIARPAPAAPVEGDGARGKMEVTVLRGPGVNHSLYVNDVRVAGSKPWGGGTVVAEWSVNPADLRVPPPEPAPPEPAAEFCTKCGAEGVEPHRGECLPPTVEGDGARGRCPKCKRKECRYPFHGYCIKYGYSAAPSEPESGGTTP